MGETGSRHSLVGSDEMSLFGEHVNEGGYGVVGKAVMAKRWR